MLRVPLMLCVVPAVFSIIVRDPPPSPNDYKYSYNIEDPTTGDSKSQHEVRQGDVVTGAYTVVGPDGTKRTVEYTADARHGFKAVVREDPVSPPAATQPPLLQHNYNAVQTVTQLPLLHHNYNIAQAVTHPTLLQHNYNAVHAVTQAPVLHHPSNAVHSIPYQTPARPLYVSAVPHLEPQSNYVEEQPTVYFTPQNTVEPRQPFDGQYFIPAVNNKYRSD